jgi:RimJ/RimL family protein N-acetyltransferase
LTTVRLTLEPLVEKHATEIAADYLDAQMWTYFPGLRPPDREALRTRFERWSAGAPADVPDIVAWENWVGVLHGTRTAVGTFQATIMRREPAALGYGVFPAFRRRGFAIEAMRAIVAHLHSEHGVTRASAEMDARNAGSIAVAVRLGLREVGRVVVDDERTGANGTELRYEGRAST